METLGTALIGRRLWRNHLLQFLALGGLLFALAPADRDSREVALTTEQRRALHLAHAQKLGVPRLTPAQQREVDTRALEDEVLYREALRLGLDRNDTVVRQRLAQKALFLAEELSGASRPATEADLRAFYASTRARWRRPERLRLWHVYAREREALAALQPAARAAAQRDPEAPPALGEAFPLARLTSGDRAQLADLYGPSFAEAAFALPAKTLSEPVQSKHGWHLVQVLAREPGGQASYEEVRGQLPLAYLVHQKQQAAQRFLQQALTRYDLTIEGRPAGPLTPSQRVAPGRVAEGMD